MLSLPVLTMLPVTGQPHHKDILQRTGCEGIEATVCARFVVVEGAAPHGCSHINQEGHVGRVGERGTSWFDEEEGGRMGGLRGRGSSGVWHHGGLEHRRTTTTTTTVDPGVLYSTLLCEGGCRFMAGRVGEGRGKDVRKPTEEKRKAEQADKVEVAPGVTVQSSSPFRVALIGPTQGPPKRRRLTGPIGSLENP